MKKLFLIVLAMLAMLFVAGETINQAQACGPNSKCPGHVYICSAACDGEAKMEKVCAPSSVSAQATTTSGLCSCYTYHSDEYNDCARNIACENTGAKCEF